MRSYLGIPESLGGPKTQFFLFYPEKNTQPSKWMDNQFFFYKRRKIGTHKVSDYYSTKPHHVLFSNSKDSDTKIN